MKKSRKGNGTKHKLAEVASIVSHQLKTPLSVIKGYLEVLYSEDLGKLNEDQKEHIKEALENTKKMNSLVRNFLDVSQIEEGKLELKKKVSDLSRIIKETIKGLHSLATANNCKISLVIPEKIPAILIDPIKIEQVINNIIINAVKYNRRKGKVKVTAQKKGNKILFICEDTGIGITDRERKKVFDKFYRSEDALVASTVGSGLGLFIAKAIIEKSGGKIWFKSKENEGTVFYFTLPIITKK